MKGEFYKMEFDAWDEGTIDLSLEEEAAYLRLCHQMYRRRGAIPQSERLLCALWRCHPNRARHLLARLLAAGKIFLSGDGLLSNPRVEAEIEERAAAARRLAEAGRIGGKRSGESRRRGADSAGQGGANGLIEWEDGEAAASGAGNETREEESERRGESSSSLRSEGALLGDEGVGARGRRPRAGRRGDEGLVVASRRSRSVEGREPGGASEGGAVTLVDPSLRWGDGDTDGEGPAAQPAPEARAGKRVRRKGFAGSLRGEVKDADGVVAAVAAYNAAAAQAGWPRAVKVTTQRLRRLKDRLRELGGAEGWEAAMRRAAASPFLNGTSGRSRGHEGWRPDFEFFLRASTQVRLAEGFYGAVDAGAGAREASWGERLELARRQRRWARRQWGPAPGEAGCRVPAELVQAGDGEGWEEWGK